MGALTADKSKVIVVGFAAASAADTLSSRTKVPFPIVNNIFLSLPALPTWDPPAKTVELTNAESNDFKRMFFMDISSSALRALVSHRGSKGRDSGSLDIG